MSIYISLMEGLTFSMHIIYIKKNLHHFSGDYLYIHTYIHTYIYIYIYITTRSLKLAFHHCVYKYMYTQAFQFGSTTWFWHATNGLLYSATVDASPQLDVECHNMISNAYIIRKKNKKTNKLIGLEIDPRLKMIEKMEGFLVENSYWVP